MSPQISPWVMASVVVICIITAGRLFTRAKSSRSHLRYLSAFLISHLPLFLYGFLAAKNPFDLLILSVLPWMFSSFLLFGPTLWFWAMDYCNQPQARLVQGLHVLPALIALATLLMFGIINPYEYTLFRVFIKLHLVSYLVMALHLLWHQGIVFNALYSVDSKHRSSFPFWATVALFLLVLLELLITLGLLVPESSAMTPLILLRALFVAFWASLIVIAEKLAHNQKTHISKIEDNSVLKRCTVEAAQDLMSELETQMIQQRWFLEPELSLNGLANQMQVSPYLLSEVINQQTGKSYYHYINSLRIKHAQTMVAQSPQKKWQVAELCYASGFNNRTSFTNAFKKCLGCTPSAFLRQSKLGNT